MIIFNILLSRYSSGSEAAFAGLIIGAMSVGVMLLYNFLKPKVKESVVNITVQTNPNTVNLIKKGYVELGKKQLSEAILYFKRALELSPENTNALGGLTIAYHLKKDYENSKRYADEFVNHSTLDNSDLSISATITYINGHHAYMEGDFETAKVAKENTKIMANLVENSWDLINDMNLY